ncbi:MAG: substrate-binding domain-containing protein [Helicobacteraceae bacterium]|jgi:phosphate transport system substrate-binding protein|nr:substrate-binding domain-containing protein [Helicobacteraceae bacterium]
MKFSKVATALLTASLICPFAAEAAVSFDSSKKVIVVSREDGSGTRGAFIELLKIEVKTPDGKRKDMTTKEAIVARQTDVVMTTVAQNKYAIGYISLGSLNKTIKAVNIDGVKATAENVKNGTYPISRPFNIATKGEPSALANDFIDFIFSAQGQAVVAKSYVAIKDKSEAYESKKLTGRLVVAGSSSVTPVMEKLKEAYIALNPQVKIEIQMSDSSAGLSSAIAGTCDIGMASRDLKDSEKAQLQSVSIAIDGLAVIVNNDNPVAKLTQDEVRSVFTGGVTKWSELIK